MKKIAFAIFSLYGFLASAQTLDDVELFNVTGLYGTPRYLSMGGAFTALGNDFSGINLNPAGAAVYRSSRFGGSLGFGSLSADQQGLFNASNNYKNFQLTLDNLGFVKKSYTKPYTKDGGWAFAITYNKLADFDREYTLTGQNLPGINDTNTLGQYYLRLEDVYPDNIPGARGLDINSISNEAYAAYQAGVLVDIDGDGTIDDFGYGLNGSGNTISYQRRQFGSSHQFGFSLAGETDRKFYYGLSLNFPTLQYTQEDMVSESDLPTDTFPFDVNSYSLNRTVAINATGVNLNFGAILVPTPWLRIGASVQTPSWYRVSEVYEFDITATHNDVPTDHSDLISTGDYYYRLRSPAIYRVGLGFLLPQKRGVISIDYENRNPSKTNIGQSSSNASINDQFTSDANGNVKALLTSVNTLKAGVELRFGPVMLRGGSSYSNSLYDIEEARSDIISFSGGIGYQNEDFGMDLALVKSSYTRYDVVHPFLEFSGEESVKNDFSMTSVVLGFHVKF